MSVRRCALPLPRYVLRKHTKTGWAYYFNVPLWARKAGCPIRNEALGVDYQVAVERAGKPCCLPSMHGASAKGQKLRQFQPLPERSIGSLPSIALTDASRSLTAGRSAITNMASSFLAVMC